MLARLTMLPWLILIVALAPQANSLSTVLKDAADRFDVVRMHGQPADESAEFVNFLVRQEPNLGDDPVFRHAEARYLLLLGDLQHSREVFARIPDDALSDPSDLLARLADAYGQDPARALSLAGRASSTADPEGRNLFVDWVHGVLASRLAPSRGDHVQERAFLEALFTSGDDIQNKTTAALRMWAEAQTTRDPARLRQLMSEEFPTRSAMGLVISFFSTIWSSVSQRIQVCLPTPPIGGMHWSSACCHSCNGSQPVAALRTRGFVTGSLSPGIGRRSCSARHTEAATNCSTW